MNSRESKPAFKTGEELVCSKEICFTYDKNQNFVLNELDFELKKGEFYALLGGNGTGKSTLLKLLAGIIKPQTGKVKFKGRPLKTWKQQELAKSIGYLPQNLKLFFIEDSVEKEIQMVLKQWDCSDSREAEELLEKFGITHLKQSHPYDLSGGELQKAAMACVLLRKPEILFLDEPTKGLDPISKENLAKMLLDLHEENVTILMATHDIEFAAQHATRCGMMFQGKISSEEIPENFFNRNFFYTTMVQRLFRHVSDNRILTVEEASSLCK